MLSFIALVTLFLTCIQTAFAKCRSYGLDYKDGKNYQMQRSSNPFAGTEKFKGCENDQAHNVIVDPQGNESECSMAPMQPGDTPVSYTCDSWTYDSMYTGEWSIIVISNNGNGEPVNFQRDFYLDFGDSAPAGATSSSADSPLSTLLAQTTLLSETSLIPESAPAAETSVAADTTQAFTFTLFGRDGLPPVPTTLLRVMKRNETEPKSASYPPKEAEPTTTVDVTVTSHITSFLTVEPMHTPVHVPMKSLKLSTGWNGTNTHETTSMMMASSLMTAAPSTTMTVTVLEATPSSEMAPSQPTMDAHPVEDHVAPIAPTSLGKHYNDIGKSVAHHKALDHSNGTSTGAYSQKFRMALFHGDKPDEETRRQFVEERKKYLHGI